MQDQHKDKAAFSASLYRVLSLLHACFARPASHPGLSLTRDPAGAYRSTPTLALGFEPKPHSAELGAPVALAASGLSIQSLINSQG